MYYLNTKWLTLFGMYQYVKFCMLSFSLPTKAMQWCHHSSSQQETLHKQIHTSSQRVAALLICLWCDTCMWSFTLKNYTSLLFSHMDLFIYWLQLQNHPLRLVYQLKRVFMAVFLIEETVSVLLIEKTYSITYKLTEFA